MINITYLKLFYDAALMGSVSEAARRNFITQPAVSQAISKLEKALKVPLCIHKKLQFKLTEEGEIVLKYAREIFVDLRQLQDALDEHRAHPQMPLHFVTTNSIGLALLPDFIPIFKETHKDVALHFQFGGLTQINGWLKQGIAEFGLVLSSPHVANYQQIPLYSGQFCLFKHKKEIRSVEKLGIYVEHKEGLLVPEFLALFKKPLAIREELSSWEMIARTLEKSGGYGLLPDLVANTAHLVRVSEPSISYQLIAIAPKGMPLSYSARMFLEKLRENFIA